MYTCPSVITYDRWVDLLSSMFNNNPIKDMVFMGGNLPQHQIHR